jgi:hypothetical protein
MLRIFKGVFCFSTKVVKPSQTPFETAKGLCGCFVFNRAVRCFFILSGYLCPAYKESVLLKFPMSDSNPIGMPAVLAPIVVFCYNRPQHLRQTFAALRRNRLAAESTLIVFSDGARNSQDEVLVKEVRIVVAEQEGFQGIQAHASPVNKGLARSVIEGVSQVLETHGRVIVLEDDMLCTTDFLDYMNSALTTYQNRPDIFSVTGYTPPFTLPDGYPEEVYLAPRASSWGWGTWQDRWQQADWQVRDFPDVKKKPDQITYLNRGGNDLWPMLVKQQRGVIDSWAIRWTFAQTQHGAYGLYPVRSKIRNSGTDGSGTNFTFSTGAYGKELSEGMPDPAVLEAFRNYYGLPLKVRIKNLLKYGI